VVLASCVKAPLLCLLAIPVFSARGQWRYAAANAALGVVLFAVQPRIWPRLFAHYLQAVNLQFLFNRDFSSSPAGVASDLLFDRVPYQITSGVVYLLCAIGVLLLLYSLSRQYYRRAFGLEQWAPVLVLGVFLLNPRLMEYDLMPLTMPMLLVLWRSFGRHFRRREQIAATAALVVLANLLAIKGPGFKVTESALLMATFVAGCRDLWLEARVRDRQTALPASAADRDFAGAGS
jgi:hypothetical protein